MFKIAAIIGGVLLLAGVALAGTVTSLGAADSPTIGKLPPSATTTAGQGERSREREARGRADEPGEDLRGPCDEVEHANDARCAGGRTITITTHAEDRGRDRGRDAGDDHGGRSGRDGGGERGHGGHGGDD